MLTQMTLERWKLHRHVSLQTFADFEETNCYQWPVMAEAAEKSKVIDETDEVL